MQAIRANTIIIPNLRDIGLAGVTSGLLSNITMATAGTFFTQVIDIGNYNEAIAFLNVTANTGDTLDIKFQTSADGKSFTDLSDAFSQVTTTNSQTIKKLTANFGKYIRAVIGIAGSSPSYTFTLSIVAKG